MGGIPAIGPAYVGQTAPAAPRAGIESTPGAPGTAGTAQLSTEEQKEVRELKQRDREVRQHEQAHLAAAGRYAKGGARFEYERGPDGRQYAVGGEVSLDTSPERTPERTVAKAQALRRAAMAPAEPSPQDRRVAAEASQMETKARRELAEQKQEVARETGESPNPLAAKSPGVAGAFPNAGPSPAPGALAPHGPGVRTLDIQA